MALKLDRLSKYFKFDVLHKGRFPTVVQGDFSDGICKGRLSCGIALELSEESVRGRMPVCSSSKLHAAKVLVEDAGAKALDHRL